MIFGINIKKIKKVKPPKKYKIIRGNIQLIMKMVKCKINLLNRTKLNQIMLFNSNLWIIKI